MELCQKIEVSWKMNDNMKHLFNPNFLRIMLQCSNRISKDATDDEMFKVWDDWLRINKEFRMTVQTLNEEDLKQYTDIIGDLFKGVSDYDKTYFAFDVIKFHLKTFMRKKEAEEEPNKKGILDTILKEADDNVLRLTPLSFNDFMNKIDNKEYYIKNILGKGTINMIYSPPACMKTFISYYMGLCLATGKDFLNQKTKQVNVGYFDWENPMSDVQNRIKGMCKGLDIDITSIDNFYFFPKQPTLLRVNNRESYVIDELRSQLIEFIHENDIKVLFFDTLRRLGNFDENDSGSINTIKSSLFDPLINELNVCIVFLHHTNKEGKDYRGSVDIEGILDTAYSVTKIEKEDSITIKFKNTKRRNNELELLTCSVQIDNEEYEEDGEMYERITNVKFLQSADQDEEEPNEYKAYKDFFVDNLVIGDQYKNKEMCEMLKEHFGVSSSTTSSKILKWLIKIDILKSFGEHKSKYYILNPSYSSNEEGTQLKELEKHFHKMFKDNQLVSIELLIDKFEEKFYSIIANDWITKGWLNNTRSGYLGTTDLFKQEYPDDIDVEEVDAQ